MVNIERLGEVNANNCGCIATIIKYNSSSDVIVRFNDEHKAEIKTTYSVFKSGSFVNPYYKSVYGVGYAGLGDYKSRVHDEPSKEYLDWKNMFQRCYSEAYHKKKPSYVGCTVDNEWHNFQNFAKWHEENYYSINNERMALDKDILVKKNKIYSANTCLFVPMFINSLFIGSNTKNDLPIGVIHTNKNKENPYRAMIGKKQVIYIGEYKTPEKAFQAYKKAKEQYIKEVAEIYRDKIPHKLYSAMINYVVEITD